MLFIAVTAALVAAPAAQAARPKPPTKLWYKVKAGYVFTNTTEVVRTGPLPMVETAVIKGRFDVHTQKGEAPLLRRDRDGDIGFGVAGGAAVVGQYQNIDWSRTTRWATVPNSDLNGCSTDHITKGAHLSANPQISGFVSLRGGRFNNTLSTAAQMLYTDDSGIVICDAPCPRVLPGRSSVREESATSCTFRPEQPSTGPAPVEHLPWATSAIVDQLNAQHDFEVPTGFGKKKLKVTSTAKATQERTLAREGGFDPPKLTETVDETFTLNFTRCPGAGRKPC
jgi:hypothetical protein